MGSALRCKKIGVLVEGNNNECRGPARVGPVAVFWSLKHLLIEESSFSVDPSTSPGNFAPIPLCVSISQSVTPGSNATATFNISDAFNPSSLDMTYSFSSPSALSYTSYNDCINTTYGCGVFTPAAPSAPSGSQIDFKASVAVIDIRLNFAFGFFFFSLP